MVSEVQDIVRIGKAPNNEEEFYRIEYVAPRWGPNASNYCYVTATDELGAYAKFMRQERLEQPTLFETRHNQKEQNDV